MKKPVMVALAVLLLNSSLATAGSQQFSAEAFGKIEQQFFGKRWLLLLWSVDCPPCYKELALVGKLQQSQKALPVVIVNTDDDDSVGPERDAVIEKYRLQGLSNLHFADGQATRARMAIDSQWYGELPRAYFYQADGKRVGLSGLVAEDRLKRWLLF